MDVQSLKVVVLYNNYRNFGSEILKSAVIKALMQINSSHNVPKRVAALECAYCLRTEAIMNSSNEAALLALAS